jgi:2-hydroxy-3-keto-5-methylthiopentenyl-1-phosphate phosphatase
MSGRGAVVFLDFDGTITLRDATDAILDAFADPEWLQIEEAWLSGHVGSRECLAAQMALVNATQDQVDRLLDDIGVDPGLATLLDACAARMAPVHIVSDGFDYCIERILGRPNRPAPGGHQGSLLARMTDSQIASSRLRLDGGRWRTTFAHPPTPCAHGCATCKPTVMEDLNAAGAITVFVGDGMSDRYAAACADIVFAKNALAAYCDRASIPYTPYDTLAAVANGLERLRAAGPPRSRSERVFPAI